MAEATTKTEQALQQKEAGNELYKAKDYEAAIAAYGRAIELAPESECAALCYSNRSAVFQIQKKYAKAEKDARACLQIKPDFIRGYMRLAIAQRRQGKFDEATATVNDGLKRSPDDADLLKALKQVQNARQKSEAKSAAPSQANSAAHQARLLAAQKELTGLNQNRQQMQGSWTELHYQVTGLERGIQRTGVTLEELSKVPDDCGNYLSVGKMYMKSPMPETKGFLNGKKTAAEEKLQNLKNKKQYMEKQIEANEKEISTIIAAVKRSV